MKKIQKKSDYITKLTNKEAEKFFLEEKNYYNFDLPPYFHLSGLINKISLAVKNKNLENICKKIDGKPDWPKKHEGVNYLFLDNKNGAYAWRPFQLIHPVLYVDLVKTMTIKENWNQIVKRFKYFSSGVVECISIPRISKDNSSHRAHQVSHWWDKIEQSSIKLSLEYEYIFATDITNYYGSIYTHTIDWALCDGGKNEAKQNNYNRIRNKIGTIIDEKIEGMNYGQTNGIPQGSTLMDFVSEMILGYADIELSNLLKSDTGIKNQNYKILRYRDDYRIFVKNPIVGKEILKHLNKVLSDFGLKMNPCKTSENDDVILSSIKKEKMELIFISPDQQSYQRDALRIYQLSKRYPNSGMLLKELGIFYDRIEKKNNRDISNLEVLISIFVMIAFSSPKTINWVAAILSIFLEKIKDSKKRKEIIVKIHEKFKIIPNSSLIDVWLQRIAAPLDVQIRYSDKLTEVAVDKIDNLSIWKSDWLVGDIASIIKNEKISSLNEDIKNKKILARVSREEVELFRINYMD